MWWLRLALCSLLFTDPALGGTTNVADKIYYGGDIITADDSNPLAEAVAVADGRIVKAGRLGEVVRLRGAGTEIIDLDGRTLAPGFIDAHGHLSRAGLRIKCVNLMPPPDGRSGSIRAIQETLRLWLAETRRPGTSALIIGFGYTESQFTPEHSLTRDDLDAVSMTSPVVAIHLSGEKGVYNSKALEIAGIVTGTPDPYGGTIHRRTASDDPNGVLEGAAHYAALEKVISSLDEAEFTSLINAGQKLYAASGYTTAQDGSTDPGALAAYPRIAAVGGLRIDVAAYPDLLAYSGNPLLRGPLHSRNYTNGFRIGGVMLRLRGARRHETARLRQSYLRLASGPVRTVTAHAGFSDGEATALTATAFRNGWHLLTAARGAAAIDQFIEAVRVASLQEPRQDRRPVLILRQPLQPDQVGTIRELGIVPAFSPDHALARDADGPVPGNESGNAAPLRTAHPLTGRHARFSAYHIAPASAPDALHLLSRMIEKSESAPESFGIGTYLTRLAAFKSVTLWAAYQHHEEDRKGSIEAGKLADLVILSANPLTADPGKIGEIEVLETLKEGEAVYIKPTGKDEKKEGADKSTDTLACADSETCLTGLTGALGKIGSVSAESTDPSRPGRSASLKR